MSIHTDDVVVVGIYDFLCSLHGTWRSLVQKSKKEKPPSCPVMEYMLTTIPHLRTPYMHRTPLRKGYNVMSSIQDRLAHPSCSCRDMDKGPSGVTLMSTREHDGVMSLPNAWLFTELFPSGLD